MTVEFPPRPEANQDPWYSQRERYDQAIEDELVRISGDYMPRTRWIIREPTDLNDLRDTEHVGSYAGRLENIINGPEELSGNPLLNLEIQVGAENGVRQLIFVDSAAPQIFVRLASSTRSFGAWKRILSTDDVNISTDRFTYEPGNNARMVYLLDENSYMYDFTKFPDGLERVEPNLNPDGEWRRNYSSSLNGRGIRWHGALPISVLGLSESSGFRNGDILTRMTRNTIGSLNGGLVARAGASSNGQANRGYIASVISNSGENHLAIGRFDPQGNILLASTAVDVEEGDIWYIRFNLRGTQIQAKLWLEGDAEPEDWMVAANDNRFDSGFVGFRSADMGSIWDVLSVNESGGHAV